MDAIDLALHDSQRGRELPGIFKWCIDKTSAKTTSRDLIVLLLTDYDSIDHVGLIVHSKINKLVKKDFWEHVISLRWC